MAILSRPAPKVRTPEGRPEFSPSIVLGSHAGRWEAMPAAHPQAGCPTATAALALTMKAGQGEEAWHRPIMLAFLLSIIALLNRELF